MGQHDLHVGGVGLGVMRSLGLVQIHLAPQELVPLLLEGQRGGTERRDREEAGFTAGYIIHVHA